jgi:hypothetical protein
MHLFLSFGKKMCHHEGQDLNDVLFGHTNCS